MSAQFHPAEQDRGGNGAVTNEKQPGEDPPRKRESRRELLVIQP
jgi:hypothetical protein